MHNVNCLCPQCQRAQNRINHRGEQAASTHSLSFQPELFQSDLEFDGFETFATVMDDSRQSAAKRSNSESLRWVQKALNQILGLRLPVNGISEPKIRSAVRSFQQREGLPVTGIVRSETEQALMASLEALDSEASELEWEEEVNRSSADYNHWIQQSLNQIMRLQLTVDGIVGPKTRSAIRSFQQQRYGLTVNGIVDQQTEAALIAAGAPPPPQTPPSGAPSAQVPSGKPDIVNARGIQVARRIAPQVETLLVAAAADGVQLGGGGFRSPEAQIELRKKHCGTTYYDIYQKPASQCVPPTAPPGRSRHEQGLAIDFTYNGQGIKTRDNPGFLWLSRNAARFGLYNLPSEPWHWSMDGK